MTLASDDETEATVPATVTIPAGQSSVTVPVTPQDDDIVDGTQFPTITASAPGFDPVTETIAVNDDDVEPVVCTFDVPDGTEVDENGVPVTKENGDPITVILSRSGPTDQPLEVTLASSDTSEATVPATVTIPAGQSSVEFLVTPADDNEVDGPQFPEITASGSNIVPVTGTIRVNDDDETAPELSIEPAPGAAVDSNGNPIVDEGGEPLDAIEITRSGPTDQPLTVTLASDDETEATVPATVTIPAGQSSVTVPVTPQDDDIVDGTQFPTITASAPGFDPVTETIAVNDDDVAELSIEPAPGAAVDGNGNPIVDEGGEPLDAIEITRSGPTDQPLTVTLASDDETEATVPATVTIPAGQSSVTVPVTPQDDDIVDGTQFPTITASAPGFDPVTETIAVNDDDVANSAPVANDDVVDVALDATAVASAAVDFLLENDTDPDGDPLQVSSVEATSAKGASVWLTDSNNDGVFDTISYDPTASAELSSLPKGETVSDVVTYTVSDGQGGFDTAEIAVTVAGTYDGGNGNQAPIANDDVVDVTLVNDEIASGVVDFLLENDTDPDGDPLQVSSVEATSEKGASVWLTDTNNDGVFDTISYDPTSSAELNALDEGETVTDIVTYTVSDGQGGFDTAEIAVKVMGTADGCEGLVIHDDAGVDEYHVGTEHTDTFIIDSSADEYCVFSLGEDGKTVTIIESKTTSEVNVLVDFEQVHFNDDTVSIDDCGCM